MEINGTEYITPKEVVGTFGGIFTISKLSSWRIAGKGPKSYKVEGVVLYKESEVQEFINDLGL